jgi:hypothetical protein
MYEPFQQTDTLWIFWLSEELHVSIAVQLVLFQEWNGALMWSLVTMFWRNLFPSLNSWRCDRATSKYSFLCLSAGYLCTQHACSLVDPSRSWTLFCVAFWWTAHCSSCMLNYDLVFKLGYPTHVVFTSVLSVPGSFCSGWPFDHLLACCILIMLSQ